MKKIILIAVVLLAVLYILFPKALPQHTSAVPTITPTSAISTVSVTLNNGSTAPTVSGITAQNAFGALQEAAKKQNITLKTKQYDFGVFVEQIGGLANTKEKSWIYFVNGKAGTVAADKQKVHAGDQVEWKYVTPTME
jgi:hypothetical protein